MRFKASAKPVSLVWDPPRVRDLSANEARALEARALGSALGLIEAPPSARESAAR